MTVPLENKANFELEFNQLVGAILANEPGVKLYHLCRSRTDTSQYRLIEIYDDQAALDHHLETQWYKSAVPKIMPLVAGNSLVEYYDNI
jgi:quinol monooxygenase YgiN